MGKYFCQGVDMSVPKAYNHTQRATEYGEYDHRRQTPGEPTIYVGMGIALA